MLVRWSLLRLFSVVVERTKVSLHDTIGLQHGHADHLRIQCLAVTNRSYDTTPRTDRISMYQIIGSDEETWYTRSNLM